MRISRKDKRIIGGAISAVVGLCCCGCLALGVSGEDSSNKKPRVEETSEPNRVSVIPTSASSTPKKTTSSPKPKRTTNSPTPRVRTTEPAEEVEEVYYANCSEARAKGAAPLYAGEPGYRLKLDRNRDGVACE